MAVGGTQVVQWVNVSYTVCDKSTGTCGPAIAGNLLWQALGGICYNNNAGDIIAQWDVAAHRWLLTPERILRQLRRLRRDFPALTPTALTISISFRL